MVVSETERLRLCELTATDAPFILALLNDPDWLRFIGDRNVRSLDDARAYIARGPSAMYRSLGYGLWSVEHKQTGQALGVCGLFSRTGVDDVDIGFAFLPAFRKQGFAREAAGACLQYAQRMLQLKRVVAITTLDNLASAKLLESIGMRYESSVRVPGDPVELRLFAIAL